MFISSSTYFCGIFEIFYIYRSLTSVTRYNFTSLFPIEMSSVSFPCLITLAATPSTMLNVCMCTQLCPIHCHPMDSSPPHSSVHGIFQARILNWVSIFLLQGIFRTHGSNTPASPISPELAGRFFTTVPTGMPHNIEQQW